MFLTRQHQYLPLTYPIRLQPSHLSHNDRKLLDIPHMVVMPEGHEVPVARRFISHVILYLRDSPTGMFLCWAIGSRFKRRTSGIDSQRRHHDQQNNNTEPSKGMCYNSMEIEGTAPCITTYRLQLANRQCEQGAQSWPLAKRVVVAGIICLYT